MNTNTVAQLRQNKYNVRVVHYRYPADVVNTLPLVEPHYQSSFLQEQLLPAREMKERKIDFSPNGGLTEVYITAPDGAQYFGQSKCHWHDNFNRKIALKIAIGRALKHGRVEAE